MTATELEPGAEFGPSSWIEVPQDDDRRVRRGDRRPPVDPRRPREGRGRPVRHDDRPRLPHALAPARDVVRGRAAPGRRHGGELRPQQGSVPRAGAGRLARARHFHVDSVEEADWGFQAQMTATVELEGGASRSASPRCSSATTGDGPHRSRDGRGARHRRRDRRAPAGRRLAGPRRRLEDGDLSTREGNRAVVDAALERFGGGSTRSSRTRASSMSLRCATSPKTSGTSCRRCS